MSVCRAYGYTPDQVYELDFLLYSVALMELGKNMPIERSFRLFVGDGPQERRSMSVDQRRQAIRAKS
jgi:type IV secretory pathway VirB9-like protein